MAKTRHTVATEFSRGSLCLVSSSHVYLQFIQLSTVVIGALVVGFIKSWKLTLVSSAAVPVVAAFGGLVAWAVHKQEVDSAPFGLSQDGIAAVASVFAP